MSLEINKIHVGDARTLLNKIDKDSIALSVWSPPYFLGKEYEKYLSYDDWVNLLKEVVQAHEPILKPGGFLVVNIADILCFPDEQLPRIQAANPSLHKSPVTKEDVLRAREEHPEFNRYQLAEFLGVSEQTIDRRLNGNNIRGGKYATQTRVHLVSDIIDRPAYEAGLYLYDRRVWHKDPAWQNSKWHNTSYRAVDEFEYLFFFWKPGEVLVDRNRLSPDEWSAWGSRAVWEIPSVRANDDHEAKFPVELPRRIIQLLTAKNDVVLDCFMGSGTTAIAALREERNYIGIELLEKYAFLAEKRIAEEKQKIEAQKRQLRMFEEVALT
ncbi:MAG: site-specific DNA-methyltransferase [Anaerolineales bacterium]|nr:MAG: site-specific DNA-methyltransferase [Anaerolineales bacterium]